MKFHRFLFPLFFIAALGGTSCSSSDDGGSDSDIEFRVSPTALSFSAAGESKTLAVVSGKTPSVTSQASWLTIAEASHSDKLSSTSYSVTADANPTTADRTATIQVAAGSNSSTVQVTQKAGTFAVLPTELTFSPAGGAQTVTVSSYLSPEVTSSAGWLTAAVGSVNGGSSSVTVTAAQNTAQTSRTATLTVKAGTLSATVSVTQAAAAGNISAKAADIARLMYPGWNLGNTLEATGNGLNAETSWQSTRTTQQIIDAVRDAGFRSVRIPCSWDIHSTSGIIDANWMARVKEVVDYCINDGLYVVLNDHWDNGWIEVLGFSKSSSSYQAVDESTITAKIARLKEIWTQIATAFKDYDEHLLFAGLNEPFQEYSLFSSRHAVLTPILIRYNTAFVEAVRATGGNNSVRTLVVQGPSTDIESSVSHMPASKLPEAAEYLMVEVHYYDPGQFCGTYDATGDKACYYWGASNHGSDHNPSYGEESYLRDKFTKLRNTYTSQGYPVIIGEYAAQQRTLTASGTDQTKHNASVKYYYQYLNQQAVANGIIAFAWDTNYKAGLGTEAGSSTIIDRTVPTVVGTNALEGIRAGVAAGTWPY